MNYDCSAFQYNNITAPNVQEQKDALGAVYVGVGITGTVTTILLVILFVINVYRHILKSPAKWRRLLAWITSTPMVVSFLSLIIFLVPRAGDICDTVKQVYLPFVLMHFIDLALMILGGEEGVIRGLVGRETPLSLCTPPCCCWGMCFRHLTFTKIKLRIVRGLIYQAPVFQLVLIMSMTILEFAELISNSTTDIASQFFSFLNIIAFMMGIWGFNIATKALRPHLAPKWERSILKSKVLSAFILLLKLQNFILGIIGVFKTIPCVEPNVSEVIMRKTIDAGLTMLEAFLFGILFYVVYRAETDAVKKHSVDARTGEIHLAVDSNRHTPAAAAPKKYIFKKKRNNRSSSSSSSDDEADYYGKPVWDAEKGKTNQQASPATLERRQQLLSMAAAEDDDRSKSSGSQHQQKVASSFLTTEC